MIVLICRKNEMNMETYARNETIVVATSNTDAIKGVKEIATRMSKKIFYAEPNSPDILAVPCVCVVADKKFVGAEYLQTFIELTSDQKTKESIIFLILIDDLSVELIGQKTIEAVLKVQGIYMYPHKKQYRIMLHQWRSYGWGHSPIDIDGLEDLKEIMQLEKAKTLGLGYFDILDNSPNIHEHSIKFADFNQEHFKWLIAKATGASRYLEIN